MRFSLRSRFRGAFLGAALGEVFGAIALSAFQATNPAANQLLHPDSLWRSGRIDRPAAGGGRQAVEQTRNLIEPQRTATGLELSAPSNSAIGLLPLMLICHESPEQLRHALAPRLAGCSPAQQTESKTIAAVLSLMLQEQFLPDRLIPLLLEQGHAPIEPLQQLQSWLIEETPLCLTSGDTLSPAMAALYGVLKTPDSFSIALRQVLRLQPDPEAAALVGLFAGTHLSEAGLPIGWRYALDRYQSETLQALWGVASAAELLDLADRLWAFWSGAFHPQIWQPTSTTVTAVPRLVRPR